MSNENSILEDQLEASTVINLDFSSLNSSIPNESSKNLIEDLNELN